MYLLEYIPEHDMRVGPPSGIPRGVAVSEECVQLPQLHLYVSKEVAAEVKRRADREGISTSRYLAELVRRECADEWPEGFFEDVIGGWKGEALERPEQPPVEERHELAPRGDGRAAPDGDGKEAAD